MATRRDAERTRAGAPIIRVERVTKTFATTDGVLPVLEDVSLEVAEGEVVALLGKSGSGKSTLLRCIAGLLAPTSGRITYRGAPVTGPNPGTAMVFQSFALLPWLTVQQNVELGLEARGVDPEERRARAIRAIDLIGLDGFESAYPKELSGGMRQRVGFARALVVEPEVLLMDEPFSALDVLTAENLRGELMELWESAEFPIRSIVLVTHNIDEAVLLADRVVILGSSPGRVRLELPVTVPRQRDRNSASFQALVDRIYAVMTTRPAEAPAEQPVRPATPGSHPLPHATVDGLSGLAEILAGLGPTSIAETADELGFEVDDLLPLVDALELLGFAEIEDGRLRLTAAGETFAGADIQASKRIFARAALERAPLVRAIVNSLDRAPDGRLRAGFFRELLRSSFSESETDRQLEVATDWGRYAEQYAFDADHAEFVADPDRRAVLGEAVAVVSFAYRTVAGRRGIAPAPRPPRPGREGRRSYSGWLTVGLRKVSLLDVVVAAAVMALLYAVVALGRGATVSFTPTGVTTVDTSPGQLPYYAGRSLLRMFIALACSYAFTFVYAYVAARSRRAEKVLIPALDILQSVPVLGFLSITVTGFVALFPGSYLGLELASIFAIFTSQVWNLTFGFYHSLITQPRDLDEAARLMGLSRWRRFWKLDVPNGAIGLVWNGMMSMGGGWFFLVASEAISVLNQTYTLPGVGSYAGAAIDAGDLGKVGLGVLTMAVVVIGVNVVFWRPLVAWSERFKNEQAEAAEVQRSLVLDLLRRSHWPRALGRVRRRLAEPVNRAGDRLFGTAVSRAVPDARRRWGDVVFWAVAGSAIAYGTWRLLAYVTAVEGWSIFVTPLWNGLVTFLRVIVLVVVATAVWVPIGVRIGSSPRAARIAQPVVQILASFPANFLFPFAVAVFVATGLTLDVGGIVLMSLGAQWYILFNVIAGAQAIPTDLKEAMDDLGVRGWQRWKRLILPAIFPSYVTGGITASGGAWNASIVAEIVTYGGTTLTATGLGAYIAEATETGDFRRILTGVAVMAFYIVSINRLFWRRLYTLAERRYSLD